MTQAFNLLDESWLPVRDSDGAVREVGLLDLFARADQIVDLADTSPTDLVASYRLLVVIAFRALITSRSTWKTEDCSAWLQEGFPVSDVVTYLEAHRERFFVFDDEHPFMQVAALAKDERTKDKVKPWTQVAIGRSSGNTPLVFDRSVDASPRSIEAGQAVRHLLGFLQFTPGGLIKVLRSSDKAGPLANSAAVVPLGRNIGHTLLLGLPPALTDKRECLPPWESDPCTVEQLEAPPLPASGVIDRYARLSRGVLFVPFTDEPDTSVRFANFSAGRALDDENAAPDPMVAMRPGANNLVRLTFREQRATWRDLPSVLPHGVGNDSVPPAVLGWALNLLDAAGGNAGGELSVLVAGLASNKGKLERWRYERYSWPVALLASPGGCQEVRAAVAEAEVAWSRLRTVLATAVADQLPDSQSKDTRARARERVAALGLAEQFFRPCERTFGAFMDAVSRGASAAADALWLTALDEGVSDAWGLCVKSLGQSASGLRAAAVGERKVAALRREIEEGYEDADMEDLA